MSGVIRYLKNFIDLFFPNLCVACNNHLMNQEMLVCTKCLYNLPKTKFHLVDENPVAKLFWGRAKIENATSYFYFAKGSKYQDMMHKFKYHNAKEIGYVLGKSFGTSIKKSKFSEVDIIIPVPLHKSKLRKRGYNQSEWIGKGLAETLDKELSTNNLIRVVQTETQTNKSRFERWKNVDNIFKVIDTESLKDKHILLVDDVVTTGSTLEACANVLLKEVPSVKVSIATIAVA